MSCWRFAGLPSSQAAAAGSNSRVFRSGSLLHQRGKVPFQSLQQRLAQFSAASHETRQERISVVATQRTIVQRRYESSSAFNQSTSGRNIPLVLRSQRKSSIGLARGDQTQFIGNRSHRPDLILATLKRLPLAPLHFAAAG